MPCRVAQLQRIDDVGCPEHDEHQSNQERQPIIGLAPDEQAAHRAGHKHRDKSEHESKGDVAAKRKTKSMKGGCSVWGGLSRNASRAGADGLEERKVHRETEGECRQGAATQDSPCCPCQHKPAPVQACVSYVKRSRNHSFLR
jgi:hypothetical protein